MAFLVGSTAPGLQRLAVPFASLLIIVLGYGSQWLFATSPELEPGPLTSTQTRTFNILLACLWWTYWRACNVDPGRYEFPRSSSKKDDGKAAAKKNNKNNKKGDRRDGDLATHSSEDDDEDLDDGDDDQLLKQGGGGHNNKNNKKNAPPNDRLRAAARRRWCRKCAAPKPPRAHHCKTCGRCIPKMDHHCPWTGNCVSLQTFPHFVRFLVFTNISLWSLLHFFWQRFRVLWASRHLPAYLGPTLPQLITLTGLAGVAGLTTLVLGILLANTLRGWIFNTTMIEGWEVERHEAVLRRGGGYVEEDWWRDGEADGDDPDTPRQATMLDPVEFPYDIGIFSNLAQAMGTPNPLYWLLPIAPGPRIARLPPTLTLETLIEKLSPSSSRTGTRAPLGTGWAYEENGLNDAEGLWPPIDPDKVRDARLWRRRRREERRYRAEQEAGLRDPSVPQNANLTPEEEKAAFRRRQERDLQRWRGTTRAEIMTELQEEGEVVGGPFTNNNNNDRRRCDYEFVDAAFEPYRPRQNIVVSEGRSAWVNADGEHLGDYGVDEDAEFDDEDDDFVFDGPPGEDDDDDEEEVPLAELIRRRKVTTKDGEDT